MAAAFPVLIRVVTLAHALEFQGVAAAGLGLVELDEGALDVAAGQVAGLEALHFLRRLFTWLLRVPAAKRWMNSLSWGDLLLALGIVRLDARPHLDLAMTMSS